MKRKREIATGLLVMAIATVFGQQTPPPNEQAQTEPKQEEQAAAKPAADKQVDVKVGWSTWGVSGNEHKFRQYATPPKDLFIKELSYSPTFGRNDLRLDVKSPWQDDYRFSGAIRLNSGTTQIQGSGSRARFYDPTSQVIEGSQRYIAEGSIWQKVLPDFAISVRERMDQQDQNFEPPANIILHQRTRQWNAAARGSLWKDGFVDLSYTDWRYWDRTDVLPDTKMQRWSFGATQAFGDNLSINGSYSTSRIDQASIDTNKINTWTVGGDLILGDSTDLIVDYRNEKLELPAVQNAYDRRREMTRGRIVHQLNSNWSAQFGYMRRAFERVNADHTYVDVPKLHTFDFQVTGRLTPGIRLTARGLRETMQGGAQMETDDSRALYFRNRWTGQLKLDLSNEVANGYAVFAIHDDRNDVRDVRVRNQSLTFGGTWTVKPELELYFESSTELWSGTTSDPLAPDFNSFYPDGNTFTVGSNWTISDKMNATFNYTLFTTNNDNPLGLPGGNIRGNFFTGSFHYKTQAGYELGLTLAPWQYRDRLFPNLGYNTGLVQLTAAAKF